MSREVKRVHLDFDLFERMEKDKELAKNPWKGYTMDYQEFPCLLCNGSGKSLKGKECPQCCGMKTDWVRVEPYKSEDESENGYQMWEDVSEGSPVSPVFKKAEDLARWMEKNDYSIHRGTSYAAWLKMIKEMGSCCSGIGTSDGGISSGMSMYEDKGEKR